MLGVVEPWRVREAVLAENLRPQVEGRACLTPVRVGNRGSAFYQGHDLAYSLRGRDLDTRFGRHTPAPADLRSLRPPR